MYQWRILEESFTILCLDFVSKLRQWFANACWFCFLTTAWFKRARAICKQTFSVLVYLFHFDFISLQNGVTDSVSRRFSSVDSWFLSLTSLKSIFSKELAPLLDFFGTFNEDEWRLEKIWYVQNTVSLSSNLIRSLFLGILMPAWMAWKSL